MRPLLLVLLAAYAFSADEPAAAAGLEAGKVYTYETEDGRTLTGVFTPPSPDAIKAGSDPILDGSIAGTDDKGNAVDISPRTLKKVRAATAKEKAAQADKAKAQAEPAAGSR